MEYFHIASLALGAFSAGIWSSKGWQNIAVKLALIGFTAWAAVVVARDWFVA